MLGAIVANFESEATAAGASAAMKLERLAGEKNVSCIHEFFSTLSS